MIYPQFLWFLSAIAIPIIIHIFSKKRLKDEPFPSLAFILDREARLKNYIRLREIFLLLLRMGMITSLVMAGGMKTIPFKFWTFRQKRVIVDTSCSMEGRKVPEGISVITRNGVADMLKTLDTYRYGTLVSDMQKISFKGILELKRRYPLISPEPLPIPEKNTGITGIESIVLPYGNVKIRVKLKHIGPPEKVNISLYLNGKLFKQKSKIVRHQETIDFQMTLEPGTYGGVVKIPRDSLPFDDYYNFVLRIPGKYSVVIFSDSMPTILKSALSALGIPNQWSSKPGYVPGADLFILDMKTTNEIDYLSHVFSWGIVCLRGTPSIPGIKVQKIPVKFSKLVFKGIKLPEPIPYQYLIEGGKVVLRFTNGDPAIVRKGNMLLLPFSLNIKEIALHPSFIPFLYKLLQKPFEDLSTAFIGDTVKGPCTVKFPDGSKRNIADGEWLTLSSRGIYSLNRGAKTYLIAVNPPEEEYDLTPLNKKEMELIFTGTSHYDGTSFFLSLFLLLFMVEYLMERRRYG